MNEPYFVRLHGTARLPIAQRTAIELLFINELESCLGGAEAVVEAYRAWRDACECDANELSASTADLAVMWPSAFDTTQRVFLKKIGESNAHFEIHLTP